MASIPDSPRSARSADPTERLEKLHQFALGLLQQRTLADLLWDIAGNVGRLLGFEDCVVYLVRGDELVQEAAFGPKNPQGRDISDPIRIRVGEGITGAVAKLGRWELVRDTREDPRYVADEFSGLSELAVPITYRERVLGVLDTECSRPDGYDRNDVETLVQVATIAAPRIAHALEEEQRRQAEEDLAQANRELAVRVEERTRELRQTVDWLEQEIGVRREVEASLAAERRRLRATLRAVTEAVIAVDAAGVVRDLSDPAAKLLGAVRDDVVGRALADVCRPRSRDSNEPLAAQEILAARSGEPVRRSVVIRDPAGVEREFEQSVAEIRMPDGSRCGAVVVLTDARGRIRRDDRRLAQDKFHALAELGAGVAREFNELLSCILGSVEAARSDIRDPRVVTESFAAVRDACRRGRMLTTQLLGFARGTPPRPRSISARALLAGIENQVPECVAGRLEVDVVDGSRTVHVDIEQIRQVVVEMVGALHRVCGDTGACGAGIRVVSRVEPDAEGSERLVLLAGVDADSISAADLARSFEPSFVARPDGPGLGLATAHAAVLRHDGTMSVDAAGPGALGFRVELPLAGPESDAADTSDFPAPRLRILGIESLAEARVALRRMLRHLGHDVDVVADTAAAVATFAGARDAGRPFQVVMVDAAVASGVETAELLESLRRLDPDVRVLQVHECVRPGNVDGPWVGSVTRPLRASAVGKELARLFRRGGDESA